jgi:hypothetical protein
MITTQLPRQLISIASADLPPNTPQVILSIRGPRGGTRACESILLNEAIKLQTLLTEAIKELTK